MISYLLILRMSVVRGIRGVGGVCETCMCLARGGVGGEAVKWGVVCGVGSESGGVGLCYVCVSCESGFYV